MDALTLLGTLAVVLGSTNAAGPTAPTTPTTKSVFDVPSVPLRLSAGARTLPSVTLTPRRRTIMFLSRPAPSLTMPSLHRDDEGGAVILEMGPHGAQPLHCHGHLFPIKR
jgi:proline-rich tail region repeat protein